MSRAVAIIGSGPAGFYTAEALMSGHPDINVDMFERLPVPFGLVRYGVAPDHQKLKSVTALFETIAATPRFNFIGNVTVGTDVSVAALRQAYDAVIVATGAMSDRRLGVAGEDLEGSLSATAFVGWYNGHPDFRHLAPDLSHPTCIVVGNGNVALDVCRILAKSPAELANSDIAAHALAALSKSRVTDIVLAGRRGPVQASFTPRELRDLTMLDGADVVVDPADLVLNEASLAELAQGQAGKVLEILKRCGRPSDPRTKPKRIHLRFGLSPLRIEGKSRVSQAVFATCRLEGPAFNQRAEPDGNEIAINAGLVLRSVGYRGSPLQGVPFDARKAIIPNDGSRVLNEVGDVIPRLYAAGWIRRGPSGIIGTNRACGTEAAEAVLQDMNVGAMPRSDGRARARLIADLGSRQDCVDLAGWRRIDRVEREAGSRCGKPREKLASVAEMLLAAQARGVEAAPPDCADVARLVKAELSCRSEPAQAHSPTKPEGFNRTVLQSIIEQEARASEA